jgi:hypothetical protein
MCLSLTRFVFLQINVSTDGSPVYIPKFMEGVLQDHQVILLEFEVFVNLCIAFNWHWLISRSKELDFCGGGFTIKTEGQFWRTQWALESLYK